MDSTHKIKRIMVVDDQEIARALLSQLVSGKGHVDCAERGEEAIALHASALMDKWPYDLILMDVNMFGLLNGNQAVRCIREHENRMKVENPVPIIMVSASNQPEQIELSVEICGANGYICKPFNRSQIQETIERYLG
ncbi:hypothetical protein GMSM_24410 [Geomonas sp. Red276]